MPAGAPCAPLPCAGSGAAALRGAARRVWPGEWGEIRLCPLTAQPPATRSFLACRLQDRRWVWVRCSHDMRQETRCRGRAACLAALACVPWGLVFDNTKTVTRGRDAATQPVWTAALLPCAAACGVHRAAGAPAGRSAPLPAAPCRARPGRSR